MHTAEQVEAARAALGLLDPALAVAHAATPPFTWRVKPSGFAELIKLMLEQQVSVASAIAIWKKLEAGLGTVDPASILACDVDTLKSFGLSGQKARYALAIAEADIDFVALSQMDDATATARLVAIKGIGRWTAEAYLMGCEGRTDLFPAGDLALQEGLRMADGVAVRLSEKALYARAEAWRPYRGVAAHLLWAYYTGVKRGLIALPTILPLSALGGGEVG